MKTHYKSINVICENVMEARASMTLNNPIDLCGEWKFKWFSSTKELQRYKGQLTDTIPVPSNWEFEGHSKPNYLNIKYPKALSMRKIPSIDESKNECAIYEKQIALDEEYPLEDAYIRFDGVRSAFDLYVNGTYIGYGQGSNTPKELYIGDCLKSGKNMIRVIVYKYSVGTYLEDQDMWRLAGIFRPIHIHTLKKTDLKDARIKALPVNGYKDGKLIVDMTAEVDYIRVNVAEKALSFVAVERLGVHHLEALIEDVSLWSAEFPNLYSLEIVGFIGDKETFRKTLKIGFRDIEVSGEGLFVNGRSVLIKGVNRHEFHPEKGHALTKEDVVRDLKLLKEYNVNAIRTAHYPNMEDFYNLCDEMGFYVMNETNLETHGLRHKIPKSSLNWLPHCIDRVDRMVARDFNHPSIIFWSLGNEAGYGDVFKAMKKHVSSMDDTRPIHYEGDHVLDISDVFSTMYATPQDTEKVGKGQYIKAGYAEQDTPFGKKITYTQYKDMPFIICEFGHAMMNSLGNFKEYMDAFRKYDRCIGGFIWDFSDQSVTLNGRSGQYGGDFYPDHNDGYFCANGIFDGDRNPYPAAEEVKYHYNSIRIRQEDNKIAVYNEYSFTNLIGHTLRVSAVINAQVVESKDIPFTLESQKTFEIQMPFENYEWLNVFILNEKYDVVSKEQIFKTMPKVQFQSNALEYSIDEKTGMVSGITKDGVNILRKQSTFNFHRAPIANDWNYGNFVRFLKRDSRWKGVENAVRVQKIDYKEDERTFHFQHRFFKSLTLTYKTVDGGLMIEGHCVPQKDKIRFGMTFSFEKMFERCSYLGRGPHENYHDRKSATFINRYEADILNMSTPYMVPQENGNRTDTSQIHLSGDLSISVVSESTFDFSVWPYTQESLYNWTHLDQVIDEGIVTLNIDAKQIGVGGEKPGVLHLHEPYKMRKGQEYSFSFIIG